jgi:hypothetical protein
MFHSACARLSLDSLWLGARGIARGGLHGGAGSQVETVQKVRLRDPIFSDGFGG